MSSDQVRPFLINKDTGGNFRLTVRDTRYNSQGYPIVTAVLQDDLFPTAAAAKAHARDNFKAVAGQYEMGKVAVPAA
jgi:hypothetical protein